MARDRFGEKVNPIPQPQQRPADAFRAERTGAVTSVAVLNFIIGGLVVVVGVVAFVGVALGSAEVAEFEIQPPHLRWGRTPPPVRAVIPAAQGLAIAISLGIIFWGIAAISAGIGVLGRHQWGRTLTLVLAAFAGLVALVFIWAGVGTLTDDGGLPGGLPGPIDYGAAALQFGTSLIYFMYAVLAYLILLNPQYAAEFN